MSNRTNQRGTHDSGGKPLTTLRELARQRLDQRRVGPFRIDHEGLLREGFIAIGGPSGVVLLPVLDFDGAPSLRT